MRSRFITMGGGFGGSGHADKVQGIKAWHTPVILVAFTFSGMAALIYEVTWSRALSLVLGSTMYAVSTMLATFMAGLAIGAFLCGKYCDRHGNMLFLFGMCELGIGVAGLVSVPIIYSLPSLYLYIYGKFHLYPGLFFAAQVFLCVMVMLIPTLLMGATFPLVSKLITRSVDEVADKVSKAYSLNTMGAVIGSLAAGFLLIPMVGIKGATATAAGLNIMVAMGMLLISRRSLLRPVAIAVPLIALSAFWTGTSTHDSYLVNFHTAAYAGIDPGHHARQDTLGFTQVFHEESIEGQVRAFKTREGLLLLQVGGKLEGTGFMDLPNTLLVSFLPIAAHPDAKRLLNIGLGAGVTLAASRTAVPDVVLVEINPSVIKAVREHGLPGLLDGVTLVKNDARNYLLRTMRTYDVIASEPSYPTESGVANLFTKEYFEIAAGKLTPNGVYGQWLPWHRLHQDGVELMTKTFASAFKHVQVWKVHDTGDLIMLGSNEPFVFTEEEISARVMELNNLGYSLKFGRIMGEAEVRALLSDPSVPINTDDRPILEFKVIDNMLMYCRYCGEGHLSTSLHPSL